MHTKKSKSVRSLKEYQHKNSHLLIGNSLEDKLVILEGHSTPLSPILGCSRTNKTIDCCARRVKKMFIIAT